MELSEARNEGMKLFVQGLNPKAISTHDLRKGAEVEIVALPLY